MSNRSSEKLKERFFRASRRLRERRRVIRVNSSGRVRLYSSRSFHLRGRVKCSDLKKRREEYLKIITEDLKLKHRIRVINIAGHGWGLKVSFPERFCLEIEGCLYGTFCAETRDCERREETVEQTQNYECELQKLKLG